MKRLALALLLLAAASGPAGAVLPDEILADPALEGRAREISRHLRCLVCQNQSIDDSDAPLARDLRLLVRERLQKGDSDQQIFAFLVARYGDFVLLRPPVKPSTWLLWFAPAGLLVAGAFVIGWRIRRRAGQEPPAPLSAEERAEIERLTGPGGN
jgi:cytochrome c-type biogenesis protein CcmH